MKNIISFLSGLALHNNKEWFTDHKKQYDVSKTEFIDIVAEIIKHMQAIEPGMSNIQPKNCIFRINRDVRFSQDKSPYKNNFGASFNPEGKKSPKAGYYLHIQPGSCFVGGGIYMPMPDILKQVRQEIDYNFDTFNTIVNAESFKKWYPQIFDEDKLSRPPKDYDAANPAIEFLKLKHYIYTHDFNETNVPTSEALIKTSIDAFKALKPFNDFLNNSFEH